MSPGYPNNYGNNLNCTYEIIGDPQKYLYLTFDPEHFFVEGLKRYAGLPRGNRWLWSSREPLRDLGMAWLLVDPLALDRYEGVRS